jgi:prepilin peptidase CpaA
MALWLMVLLPSCVPVAGFAGLMAVAAIEDFRRFVIPNAVVVATLALWPLHLASLSGSVLVHGLAAAACAIALFLAGAVLYSRGFVGGGDVKLLAAASLWAGAERTSVLLMTTAILGGLLALTLLCGARLRTLFAGPGAASGRPAVPYGVAIAAAAVIVTTLPNLL